VPPDGWEGLTTGVNWNLEGNDSRVPIAEAVVAARASAGADACNERRRHRDLGARPGAERWARGGRRRARVGCSLSPPVDCHVTVDRVEAIKSHAAADVYPKREDFNPWPPRSWHRRGIRG
jgi:hypothetical protein